MTIIEEYKQALKRAEDKQFEHECGNDMYYGSYQYEEDKQIIEELKAKIKELERPVRLDIAERPVRLDIAKRPVRLDK